MTGAPDILRETRWLAAFIIPFLAIAFVILYFFPAETARLFAWDIKPPMTAMMLGSAYAGGVWFFGRALRAGRWREIRIGFPAVGTFASILGIATILHWDRFIHESLAFILWVILYFTTPVLVFATWFRQRRADADTHGPEPALPRSIRYLFAAIGVTLIVVSVVLFLLPTDLGATWPWKLTALTARVMSAMFALSGIVAVGMALDPRWSVVRIVAEAQIGSIALILVAVWRDQADIAFGSPTAWLFTLGLGGFMVLLIGLYVVIERRIRAETTVERGSTP